MTTDDNKPLFSDGTALSGPVMTWERDRSAMWAALRAPFPADQILKLPKPTSRDNAKGKCQECGGWHGLPAVHLDYVGHAEVTDRLLSVDPLWNWEPVAYDESGLPKFVMAGGKPVGLWIRLTVGGVTRLGYGSVEPGVFDAEKQLISDCIRNAAMRFGVALDLWAKSELHRDDDAPAATKPAPKAPAKRLEDVALDIGASPVLPLSTPPTSTLWERVTQLMQAEHVTSAMIRAVVGDFGQESVLTWLSEGNRTPEILMDTAKAKGARS